MQLQPCLLILFAVISLGRGQFTRASEFQNIGLGEPPRGVYIPQDSFLNVLRNPSYTNRATWTPPTNPGTTNYNLAGSYVNNVPQQTYFVQSPPAWTAPQQNTVSHSDVNDQMIDDNQERRPRRRTIRRRQRIFREENGSPQTYSPSEFQNIGFGEVPAGVYVPPDSLLNVLRNPSSGRAMVQRSAQSAPVTNDNFGLTGRYENDRPQQQFVVQPPADDEPVQPNRILPLVNYDDHNVASSSSSVDDGEYGRKLTSRNRRQQSRQGRQPRQFVPPSTALDPSMEYPADVPRDEMQSLPRSTVEYINFGADAQMQLDYNAARRSQRRQIQRRRKETGAKPKYMEPEYPPRSYSPSVFQNVGLGEPPSGVNIPSDSMLNILRDHHSQRVPKQVMRTEAARQQPSEPLSVPLEVKEEERYEPEVQPQQYSHPTVRRKPSRQRSRQMDSSDVETEGEFGSRSRQEEPVQTFRESSQQRQRSHLRNSGISRTYRIEE